MHESSITLNKDLISLVTQLNTLRGDNETWMEKERALLKHIASLKPHQRMLCRGEWRDNRKHLPAILVYNERTHVVEAHAPSGSHHEIFEGTPRYFYSTLPHEGIAREVLNESPNGSTI